MARRLTTTDLIADVRAMIDEDNQEAVDDTRDILPSLNRAQDYAANILARHYESPLLAFESVTLTAGTASYSIPEKALEQRLEKVEVNVGGVYQPVKRLSYRDITDYEQSGATAVPLYYAIVGDEYRLLPAPSATYPLRIWYLRDPDPLVEEQGRLTVINTAQNYLIVDSIGEDVSSEVDSLESFVNIVDGQTGEVKVSLQVQSISGNRVQFRTVPSRSTVYNRTISGEIPSTVEKDDLLCSASGTCIPILRKPFSNFLIQYAVAEMQRKLGGPADMEQRVLKDLEAQVERSWVGREQSLRVTKSSKNWAPASLRRRPLPRTS